MTGSRIPAQRTGGGTADSTPERVFHSMFYHLAEALFLLPWIALAAGALRKTWLKPDRLQRMQSEGASIVLAGMFVAFLLFDASFGLDAQHKSRFTEWYPWGERGLFWIGMLLFGLGFFLERRPRPGLKPWSPAGRAAAFVAILVGAFASFALLGQVQMLGSVFPWSPARMAFSVGMVPFALLYALDAFQNGPQSRDAETIY